VSLTGQHVAPYTNWGDAAQTVRAAVEVAAAGDVIVVSNGVYEVDSMVVASAANRVALTNAVTMRSMSGAANTVLVGRGPLGEQAVRCAYVGPGAALIGFTLTNGYTRTSGDEVAARSGGGVWVAGGGAVSNCVIADCQASKYGGGVYGDIAGSVVKSCHAERGGGLAYGQAVDCEFSGNSSVQEGSGAFQAELASCLVAGNGSWTAVSRSTVSNCIVRDNNGTGLFECKAYDSLIRGNVTTSDGGGAYKGMLVRCRIEDNVAGRDGGGAYDSAIYNCLVFGNTATQDGGGLLVNTPSRKIRNCTIVANHAKRRGGGTYSRWGSLGEYYNTIVYHNTAVLGSANWNAARSWSHSCTTPLPSGGGCIDDEPLLVGLSNGHITADSPCVDAGLDAQTTASPDIDGEQRISGAAVDIGCDEVVAGSTTGTVSVVVSAVATQVVAGTELSFEAVIEGRPLRFEWRWGDGEVTTNGWRTSHAWPTPGEYDLTLWAVNDSGSWAATVGVGVVAGFTNYVSSAGSGEAPYPNWATAATNVQDAVDACLSGGTVMVGEGVYDRGGRAVNGVDHRIALWKRITVQATNATEGATRIVGRGPLGNQAVRCAYVGAGAGLIGFTLTNGYTRTSGDDHAVRSGGGLWVAEGGVVSNCVIASCQASKYGGGVYGDVAGCVVKLCHAESGGGAAYGRLVGSELLSNSSVQSGSGAYRAALANCLVAGNGSWTAVAYSTVSNCVVRENNGTGLFDSRVYDTWIYRNVATSDGGGADRSTLVRCRIEGNTAGRNGGGVFDCNLYNCLVVSNVAEGDGGGVQVDAESRQIRNCTIVANHAKRHGGGVHSRWGALGHYYNTIIYHNTAVLGSANWNAAHVWSHTCSTPLPPGDGCIDDEPLLVGLSNGHLVAGSPCVDAGLDTFAGVPLDIDGETRIAGAAVDMGCDEVVVGATTGIVAVGISAIATQVVAGSELSFEAVVDGRPLRIEWQWGDGEVTTNGWRASHAWETPGEYDLVLWAVNDGGTWAATVGVEVVAGFTNYVSLAGSGEAPYTSWATGATNVQDAIDACLSGGTVLVGEGVYEHGGFAAGGVNHRIGLWKGISVVAANPAEGATRIVGRGPLGDQAIRCAYVGPGASLIGFTLTNGFTRTSGDDHAVRSGGGVWVAEGGVVSNCVIASCHASKYGGGVYGDVAACVVKGCQAESGAAAAYGRLVGCELLSNGTVQGGSSALQATLLNCLVASNASWTAVAYSTVSNCVVRENNGTGLFDCRVYDTWIYGNVATSDGGGADRSTLVRCRIEGNTAGRNGGGAYDCNLYNCLVVDNVAEQDGGGVEVDAEDRQIRNCTIVANHAKRRGGGAHSRWGELGHYYNTIIYHNTAILGSANWNAAHVWSHSCSTPLPPGDGCIDDEPLLVGLSNGHLVAGSPCVDAGLDTFAGVPLDIDGETRIAGTAVDMGCDEVAVGATTGTVSVGISSIATQVVAGTELSFEALIDGRPLRVEWRWGDGVVTTNGWRTSHAWATTGQYDVVLWVMNDGGAWAATVGVGVVASYTNYVSLAGSGEAPYANWSTAATNVQDAIDACLAGGTVLVGEGTYARGGYAVNGVNHRVGLWKAITVLATNTAEGATRIVGDGPLGDGAIRCVYVGADASLIGFTLTNGHTRSNGDDHLTQSGGGAWVAEGGVVSNCVVTACRASKYGGGVYGDIAACVVKGCYAESGGGGTAYGRLVGCELLSNSAVQGGSGALRATLLDCLVASNEASVVLVSSVMSNCVVCDNRAGGLSSCTAYDTVIRGNVSASDGGGANRSTLIRCRIEGNTAGRNGGGAYDSHLYNCLVVGNVAEQDGGGVEVDAENRRVRNCTIVGNHAKRYGGGAHSRWGVLGHYYNTIIYHNTAILGSDNWNAAHVWSHSCSTPLPPGGGCIDDDPLLAGLSNGHLVAGSPCVDTGLDAFAGIPLDIDGETRIAGAAVDIGCDEVVVGGTTGRVSVGLSAIATQVVAGTELPFEAVIEGRPLRVEWRWGDDRVTTNGWQASHAWETPGEYELALWTVNDGGAWSATVGVEVVAGFTNYVSLTGSGEAPYTSWATAATNAQDAVDVCLAGGTVLVGEGAYDRGGYEHGGANNRVGLWKPITVLAANAVEGATRIVGRGPSGEEAFRCAYVGPGATLAGVTLTNGHTRASGDDHAAQSGGGAWVAEGGVVSNCVIVACRASKYGGGAYGDVAHCVVKGCHAESGGGAAYGRLVDCELLSNSAVQGGSGARQATLLDCLVASNEMSVAVASCIVSKCIVRDNSVGGLFGSRATDTLIRRNVSASDGGGAYGGTLVRCRIEGNVAGRDGGGVYDANLYNCLVVGNVATQDGGGVQVDGESRQIHSCTIVGNHAWGKGGGTCTRWGPGLGEYYNTIVYHNTADAGSPNWVSAHEWRYCCADPRPAGTGCIGDDPLFRDFAAEDYHLAPTSTCIDAGLNEDWMATAVDLDGRDRILNQVVDMGTYETPFVVKVCVLPQGAYSSGGAGLLATNLNALGLLPRVSPYGGARVEAAEIPSNAVDWMLVELVDTDGGAVAAAHSGILCSDGWIVSHDGEEGVPAPAIEGRAYTIRVKHRNHVAVESSLPVVFLTNITEYDFTTGPEKVAGGASASVELEPGVWGMIAGDCDGDGKITAVDREIVRQQAGKTGYLCGDLNLDGVVSSDDRP